MRALTLLSISLLLTGCSPSAAPGSDPTSVTTEGGTAAVTNTSPPPATPPPPGAPWERLGLDTTARYSLSQDGLEVEESYHVVAIEADHVIYEVATRSRLTDTLDWSEAPARQGRLQRGSNTAPSPPGAQAGLEVSREPARITMATGTTLSGQLTVATQKASDGGDAKVTRVWTSSEIPPFCGGLVRMEQDGTLTHELLEWSWGEAKR